jgi:hypothetical protein
LGHSFSRLIVILSGYERATRLELQDAGIREETNLLSCLVALEQGGPVRSAPGEVERDR